MNNNTCNHPLIVNPTFFAISVNIFVFLGLACFTLSLFLPVFFTSAENIQGYWVLLTGWLGMIFMQFAWYANPINLLAFLLAQKNPRIAMLLSVIALLMATGTLFFFEIPIGINYEKVFIKEFGLGFYLWYAAQSLFFLALLSNYIGTLKSSTS